VAGRLVAVRGHGAPRFAQGRRILDERVAKEGPGDPVAASR
jgi:hypothetical protein